MILLYSRMVFTYGFFTLPDFDFDSARGYNGANGIGTTSALNKFRTHTDANLHSVHIISVSVSFGQCEWTTSGMAQLHQKHAYLGKKFKRKIWFRHKIYLCWKIPEVVIFVDSYYKDKADNDVMFPHLLMPISLIADDGGPMNITCSFWQSSANSVFSDKNP